MMRKKRFFGSAVFVAIAALVALGACSSPTGGASDPEPGTKPVITITTQPLGKTVTAGGISGSLSVTATVTEGAALSYQWYKNVSATNVGGEKVTGATGKEFAIPTNLAVGDHYYFCEVAAPGAASVRSGAAKVVVVSAGTPFITIISQPKTNTEVTEGGISGSLFVTATVTGGASPAYQWYKSDTASNEDGEKVTDTTAVTASFTIPTSLVTGDHYYFCEVTAPNAAATRSDVAKVTVLSAGVPAIKISVQPRESTEVTAGSINGTLSVEAVGIGGAEITGYQWYKNTAANNEGGEKVTGATGENFTIPTDLGVGDHYYFCEITASGVAEPRRSNAATITVLSAGAPGVKIDTQPASGMEVTAGSISGTLFVEAAGIGGAEITGYQWYKNTAANNEGGEKVTGATGENFDIPTDLGVGDHYYFCEITASGVAEPRRSNVATITVKSVITINAQPEANTPVQAGKISGSLSVTATVTEGAEITGYQWYSNTTVSNEGGAQIPGATSASFDIPNNLNAGSHYYFCEVTATGGAALVCSSVATVTVQAVITVISQPVENTLVQAGKITGNLSVTASVNGGTEITGYQWYRNTTASNEGGTHVSGATSASFNIPTKLTPGEYFYFCEIMATGGAALVRSNVATVTVSKPDTNFVIALNDAPELVAQSAGAAANTNTPFGAAGSGWKTYQWYVDSVAEPGAITASYMFKREAGVYNLTVKVTDTDGDTWSGTCWVTVQ